MNWISGLAVFFIIWWIALFAMLPIGLRTQDDDGDVTLGTTSSAPGRPHMVRTLIRTTIAAMAIFAAYFVMVEILGLGFDDLPQIMPDFS